MLGCPISMKLSDGTKRHVVLTLAIDVTVPSIDRGLSCLFFPVHFWVFQTEQIFSAGIVVDKKLILT